MPRAQNWYSPRSIARSLFLQPRTYASILAGLAVYIVLWALGWMDRGRILLAWDAGGIVYLALAFRLMSRAGAHDIRHAAARADDSRFAILSVILLSIGASFLAIGQLLRHAKQETVPPDERALLIGLAVLTIVISWCVTHMAFTLHYAHEYYDPDRVADGRHGLRFPGTDAPDYWDFLYFSSSIGAASQTSDVEVCQRGMRRLVTLHAVIAFFFNTAVLALTVNIAASID